MFAHTWSLARATSEWLVWVSGSSHFRMLLLRLTLRLTGLPGAGPRTPGSVPCEVQGRKAPGPDVSVPPLMDVTPTPLQV